MNVAQFAARLFGAGLVVCAATASAWAQDYTVAEVSNTSGSKYTAPPATGVTNLGLSFTAAEVALPFEFPYFGAVYSKVWASNSGFLQFGVDTGSTSYANTTLDGTASAEAGIIAPYWDDLNDASVYGSVVTWTSGTAPTRTFYVSWEGVAHYTVSGASSLSFQVQLSEGSGRIVLAYKKDSTTSTWGGGYSASSGARTSYTMGLVAPGSDARYLAGPSHTPAFPNYYSPSGGTSNALYGRPRYDYTFDPKVFTYSGTVQFDRLVSDATGIGNSVQSAVPLMGFTVEVQRADGSLGFQGVTDANGAFSVKTYGADSAAAGNIVVTAEDSASVVRASAKGNPVGYTVKSAVRYNANLSAGTVLIGAAQDASGEKRAPFDIALALREARDWASTRTAHSIPKLEVLYDPASAALTAYTPAQDETAAALRVGSTGASNPDAWDTGVLRRVYGRHLLAAIAGSPSTSANSSFDAITDEQNAFAEGFGAYLHAAISGATELIDGTSGSTATVYDLENESLVSRKGPDVAGWVATALCDLVDGANETWDRVDGSGSAASRPFLVVDSLTAAPTATTFLAAWGALGLPGGDLSREFVHAGLVADDASEANDDRFEPTDLGDLGVRKSNLVLNLYNEDWFRIHVTSALPALYADVNFDRVGYDTDLVLDVRDAAGSVLTTAPAPQPFKPFSAVTGAVAAGDYFVRVAYKSGVRLPSYSVQAYARLQLTLPTFQPSTEGRPYSAQLTVVGGVPPYTVSVVQPSKLPPGVQPDSVGLRVAGTAAGSGSFTFTLSATDTGSPANVSNSIGSITINPALQVRLAQYLPFASGRLIDVQGPFTGGTGPLAFYVGEGSLPFGLSLDKDTMHFVGTASTLGTSEFRIDGSDSTGSVSSASTTAVVCTAFEAKPVQTPLAAGGAAAGFWFDALAGSKATIRITTAKKAVKRTLQAFILDASGQSVPGARVKVKSGQAQLTGIVCPESGRYYVVLASADGAETTLQGTANVALPKSVKTKLTAFTPSDTSPIKLGVLAGAKVSVKCTADKRSGLKPKIVALRDPSGATVITWRDIVKPTATGFTLAMELPTSGTWTLVLGADSASGAPGNVTFSTSIKQPKGVTYTAD